MHSVGIIGVNTRVHAARRPIVPDRPAEALLFLRAYASPSVHPRDRLFPRLRIMMFSRNAINETNMSDPFHPSSARRIPSTIT